MQQTAHAQEVSLPQENFLKFSRLYALFAKFTPKVTHDQAPESLWIISVPEKRTHT